jgi:ketosteroid isomerase-like protein
MSERNVELMRRLADAWNSRDLGTFVAYCDPGIEVHSAFAAVGGGLYHGPDGVRNWLRDLEDAWGEGFRVEPEAFFDFGAQTLAFVVFHGRGRQSGAEVANRSAVVVGWRDGLAVQLKGFFQREDALRDLGVSEDELEPITP